MASAVSPCPAPQIDVRRSCQLPLRAAATGQRKLGWDSGGKLGLASDPAWLLDFDAPIEQMACNVLSGCLDTSDNATLPLRGLNGDSVRTWELGRAQPEW